jgi:hypothetical protein
VRNEKNLGLIGTSNRGVMEWAHADYTLLLSADDALTPGALARAVEVLDAHPDAGFVYGAAIIFNETLPSATPEPTTFEYRLIDGPCLMEQICRHANNLPSPTVLVRTSLQKAVGGYNEATRHTSDMEMWLRLAAHGKAAAIKASQAFYRVHPNNMTAAFVTDPAKDAEQRIKAAEQALIAVGSRVDGFASWVSELKHREASLACWKAAVAFELGESAIGDIYLDFAAATDPACRNTKAWWSASAKKLLGSAPAKLARILPGRARRNTANLAKHIQNLPPLIEGQEWTWWPKTFVGKTFRSGSRKKTPLQAAS